MEIGGAPRSSWSRSPVRRATGSGSATLGLTSDWNDSTGSSACTRTAPTSQMRSRAAESPVVSRSNTTSSASSSSGSACVPANETVAPAQTIRLSPAVTSARSEHARPSEIEEVAKRTRAASDAVSGPPSSSVSTSRSSESSASCTSEMKANIRSLGKFGGQSGSSGTVRPWPRPSSTARTIAADPKRRRTSSSAASSASL